MKKNITLATVTLVLTASVACAQDAVASAARPSPNKSAESERVVVTAGAIEHSETDTIEPVSVLNQEELKRDADATLGDTLRDQPGVAAKRLHRRCESPGHPRISRQSRPRSQQRYRGLRRVEFES